MQARAALLAAGRRARRPGVWGGALGFAGLWAAVREGLGLPLGQAVLPEILLPLALLLGFQILAPLPWQWTGDGRPRADLARGTAQSLLWNTGWILALVLAVHHLAWPEPAPGRPPGYRRRASIRIVLFFSLPVALFGGLQMAERERLEAREDELQRLAREAQARALQAQMDPHALYNALGGLTELVREDPARAEEALVGLADWLRRMTRHGHALARPLAEERRLVEMFLDMEALRLGERLRVAWDWPAALDEAKAPPLLLQPLVENALKHGIAPAEAGGELRISGAALAGGALRIRVANTGRPLEARDPGGVGLANLEARLRLMGGEGSAFRLGREGDWTVAELDYVPAPAWDVQARDGEDA